MRGLLCCPRRLYPPQAEQSLRAGRGKATAALKAISNKTLKSGPYILIRTDGRPWFTAKNDKEMGKAWREHMKAAKLYPDNPKDRLHFADLRGTAVAPLAEAGCTVPEIVSIAGHALQSATRILEKYFARTKATSGAAIVKFENAKATDCANRLQTADIAKS